MTAISLTPASRLDVLSCAYLLADSGIPLHEDEALVGYLAERGVTVTRHDRLWWDIKVETNNLLAGRAAARAHVRINNRQALVSALIIGAIAGTVCLASAPAMAAEPLSIPLAERVGWWAAWVIFVLVAVSALGIVIVNMREKREEHRKLAARADDPSMIHRHRKPKIGGDHA